MIRTSLLVVVSLLTGSSAFGALDARMMRYPDVSGDRIAFVYAGDIWVVDKSGGTAHRLSSPDGEESFPRFSPDGSRIAFTGNYDGNSDVYVVPVDGGVPTRLTFHPSTDRVVDWSPDGGKVLFASSRESGKNRFNQLYFVHLDGPYLEKLPLAYGEFASVHSDGETLAFMPIARDFRTWKRYRGGMAPDIWTFHLDTYTSENVTDNEANDSQPMWHGDTLYFLSDRDENRRYNLWARESDGAFRQITHFEEFDVHFPSIGPDDIVFEAGGRLHLLDLATEEHRPIDVTVVTDRSTLKPRRENVAGRIETYDISSTGKRVVFEARGDVFTVPAEHGVTRNLTRSSGSAERYPAWSPDGKYVVFFSDRTGEYELTRVNASDGGEMKTLTSLGPGYRYAPLWSPDSKKIVWVDQTMTINLYDDESGSAKKVDQGLWMYHGTLSSFRVSWSSDSRWFAYSRAIENRKDAVFLYDTKEGALHQVTSGFYDDSRPCFDPEGKYLYLLTARSLSPIYSQINNNWIYANATKLAAIPLRKDVKSPLAARNDVEEPKKDKKDDEKKEEEEKEEEKPDSDEKSDSEEEKPDEDDAETAENEEEKSDDDKKGEKKDEKKPVEIDLDDFERRMVVLPPKNGNYGGIRAVKGKIIYQRQPRTGADDSKRPILFFDLKEREEKTIVGDSQGYELSADGKKLLVRNSGKYYIVNAGANQKLDDAVSTAGLDVMLDPAAEWRQLFADAWRLQRDFFYDPGLHGVNWPAMRERYGALLDDAVTRWDVNFIIGELIAELNASHTYRGGGDTESPPRRAIGLLGANFEFIDGAYRIAEIVDGAPWDAEARSPLSEPGLEVEEGDFLIAINGMELSESFGPFEALEGHAGKTVILTVNDTPNREDSREVLVETLRSEYRLRNLAWIEGMRQHVDEASDGRIGYVYVPDTGRGGQTELVRQFLAQFHKDGLIIDERFNSGGQIPDRFVELMNRPIENYYAVRDGKDWQWPPMAHHGPKAMLVNGWSGSGGDAFPFIFKQRELGPLIGERTWGGLIGMTGSPNLIDGGSVSVPTFGIYSVDGEWIIEGYGVDPDIEVVNDPTSLAKGEDPQLDRAIEYVLRQLDENPPQRPEKPAYPDRSGR